jgi:hypothetical protein
MSTLIPAFNIFLFLPKIFSHATLSFSGCNSVLGLSGISIVGKMQRSTSDVNLNLYTGADRMANNQESLKDDKKKRGRSPFRLVCAPYCE